MAARAYKVQGEVISTATPIPDTAPVGPGNQLEPASAISAINANCFYNGLAIRVREENSQCNYQAVDAQRFPERKTHDWNAAITPTAPGFVAQGGRF